MPTRPIHPTLAVFAAGILLLTGAARGMGRESPDELQTAERLLAMAQLRAAAAVAEQARADATGRVAALERSAASVRTEIAALQKQLLAVLAKDDPAALQTIRAQLAARQAALDAAFRLGHTFARGSVAQLDRAAPS